jgi:hypothetical protein
MSYEHPPVHNFPHIGSNYPKDYPNTALFGQKIWCILGYAIFGKSYEQFEQPLLLLLKKYLHHHRDKFSSRSSVTSRALTGTMINLRQLR